MSMTTLKWPDYVILVGFVVVSLGIGVYHSLTGGRQRTTQEFIMANRHLSIIPTSISMFVSFQSAVIVLGTTTEMYQHGIMFLPWSCFGFVIAAVICERLVVPWIYRLKLVSINDYLERRYASRAVRIFGAAGGVVGAILYMGVAMYAPSVALENATGLPTAVSMPLMAAVSVTYTALGGMRAVIWTDVFQFGAMMGGILTILIKGLIVVGGFSEVFEICGRAGRLQLADWSFDPTVRHTGWGFMFGWSAFWLYNYGLSQASVQRYCATESLTRARITVLLNIPALCFLHFVTCSIGLTVFAYYSIIRCDPLVNRDVTSPNQLLSLFVTSIFSNSHGFAGLFLATLYGGALSTVSSSLSGASANLWDDILEIWWSGIPEHRKALTNRLLVIVLGLLATGIAFIASNTTVPIVQLAFTFQSSLAGPMLGLFLIGGISRLPNWKGALVGGLFAMFVSFWVSIGALSPTTRHPTLPPTSIDGCPSRWNVTSFNDTWLAPGVSSVAGYSSLGGTSVTENQTISELSGLARFYSLSYIWTTLFGAFNIIVIGLITSLIFRDRRAEAEIDEQLLIQFGQCLNWIGSDDVKTEQHNGEYKLVGRKDASSRLGCCDTSTCHVETRLQVDGVPAAVAAAYKVKCDIERNMPPAEVTADKGVEFS